MRACRRQIRRWITLRIRAKRHWYVATPSPWGTEQPEQVMVPQFGGAGSYGEDPKTVPAFRSMFRRNRPLPTPMRFSRQLRNETRQNQLLIVLAAVAQKELCIPETKKPGHISVAGPDRHALGGLMMATRAKCSVRYKGSFPLKQTKCRPFLSRLLHGNPVACRFPQECLSLTVVGCRCAGEMKAGHDPQSGFWSALSLVGAWK